MGSEPRHSLGTDLKMFCFGTPISISSLHKELSRCNRIGAFVFWGGLRVALTRIEVARILMGLRQVICLLVIWREATNMGSEPRLSLGTDACRLREQAPALRQNVQSPAQALYFWVVEDVNPYESWAARNVCPYQQTDFLDNASYL